MFRKYYILIIFTLAISSVLILLFEPIDTIFNVTATTERIKITTINTNSSRLVLENVEISDINEIIDTSFSGSYQLNSNIDVIVERVAKGPLILELKGDQTTGKLYDINNNFIQDTPEFFEIMIKNIDTRFDHGNTILLPIEGDITLGRGVDFEVYGESNSILRSGELSMVGISKIFGEQFDGGAKKLLLGDQLIFENIKDVALGFVTVNETPAIQVAYRLSSKHAKILKPGVKGPEIGTEIRLRPLDRFLNAPFFQWLSLFFGSLVVLMTIATFLMDSISFIKNKKLYD